ncbi:MAG: prepilin-type N-terminal cleavage/methylation domain-containing protein [Patescibacteria group bacterium]
MKKLVSSIQYPVSRETQKRDVFHTQYSLRGFTSTREGENENEFSFFPNAVEAKAQRAFTLIETLVAISILLLSLAAPLSIAAQSLRSAYYARDQITAFYLAQEAVEYVRAVRDQNYLGGIPWLTGIEDCVDTTCAVDFTNFSHEVCAGDCPLLLLGNTSGLFNLSSGDPTIYRRTLEINSIEGISDEVTVLVRVSWQSGKIEREFEVQEQLFNWL